MANVISVSLTNDQIKALGHIKLSDGLGASSVMGVGIQHMMNKPRIQAKQFEMEQNNEKLYKLVQKLQKRVQELELGVEENVDK